MKKIAYNVLALSLAALAFTACDDAKNDVIDNMVYISEGAGSDPTSEVVVGKAGEKATTKINVRMAQKAHADTKVKLALDAATLDAYNKRNETEYVVVPNQYVSFPAEVTIPAGSASTEVEIEITSFDGEAGVDYAAPVKVTAADGVSVSAGSSSLIITLGKTLVQKAPKFYYDNAMKMNWETPVALQNLTLEWWARVVNTSGNGGFSKNNQALFAFESDPFVELYVRFGDIVYVDPDGRDLYNFLQIKTMGIDANYDSGNPNDKPLKWGEWIHFAHTFNGATGEVVLYVNGVEANRKNGPAGTVFNFTGLTMCASGSDWFHDYIEMAQVRLWSTTRTASQIEKFMKKEVKYTDPNLVFYLPMNEGEGETLHDVTGNGHDVTIGSADNGSNHQAHGWTEYTFE
ncbi:DUF1735 domain-containing protein [uncultured Muribaculum sp.]|uniref:BT_3987 domain-containing protein n=1 Tax=uncultured Muribaculum sp. TaxID=1918613 RepID=UPI0025F27A32|nr:DUF1735 domain-containing protein [uncultured Muribaculum sp.]